MLKEKRLFYALVTGGLLALSACGQVETQQTSNNKSTPPINKPEIRPTIIKGVPEALPTPNPNVIVSVGQEEKRPEEKKDKSITYEVSYSDRPVFFSNGLILGVGDNFLVLGNEQRMSKLVHDPRLGLEFPSDYIIATVFHEQRQSVADLPKVRQVIPFDFIRTSLQSRFPFISKTNLHYSINSISLIEVSEGTNNIIDSQNLPVKTLDDYLLVMSQVASTQWLVQMRESYYQDKKLPVPLREITLPQLEIIQENLPLQIYPARPIPVRPQLSR